MFTRKIQLSIVIMLDNNGNMTKVMEKFEITIRREKQVKKLKSCLDKRIPIYQKKYQKSSTRETP